MEKVLREKYGFTKAEAEVCVLAAKGFGNTEIASTRNSSVSGVKYHLTNIYRKMGINYKVSGRPRHKLISEVVALDPEYISLQVVKRMQEPEIERQVDLTNA